MKEIRIRKVPDKIYRVARKMAADADQSVPAFTLDALDEKIGRIADAAQRGEEKANG